MVVVPGFAGVTVTPLPTVVPPEVGGVVGVDGCALQTKHPGDVAVHTLPGMVRQSS